MMLLFALTLICVFIICYIVAPFCLLVFRYTLGRYLFSKRKQLFKPGQWAIITGATDGIGLAFAEELAADGLNIMLLSRTKEKLDSVAQSLSSTYNIAVKCVVADFTQETIYEHIKQEIDKLSGIACLINNVGMYPLDSFPFGDDLRLEQIHRSICCNSLSMASMTQIVLPRLIQQNLGSALINVASYAAIQPLPYLSLYGATKAFVCHLSESLAIELKDEKIVVQTLCPMYVNTKLVSKAPGNPFLISPKMCAKGALDMLGVEHLCYGHWLHAVQVFLFRFVLQFCFNRSVEADLDEKYKKL